MFCPNCGRENGDDAVYCQKCGRELEPEEDTRIAQRRYRPPRPDKSGHPSYPGGEFEEEETRVTQRDHLPSRSEGYLSYPGGEVKRQPTADGRDFLFSVSPTLLFVKIGYVGAVVAAFLLAAIASGVFQAVSPTGAVLLGLVLCLIFLTVPAFYHVRQKLVRYRLTETTVEIDRGLVSRTTQNIPLRRIQDVTVSSSVSQRLLGFGDIVIDNASEDGGKVILHNIDRPRKYADLLLRQMHLLDR